ncbi:uncharacterized protein LOC117169819 [Belonocnema kinseyi]|uniref:uncharacterized protein LOC117169819 n=1 Tax=Belonocnema kinseyi TaxID=2817044 RepID=UPI00143DC70F|nr:uncharacterized protein LOC117169819 [Belonocnema kinseyi]
MKNYTSLTTVQINFMENARWLDIPEGMKRLTNDDGYFAVTLPLCMILGVAEDYQMMVVNAKRELVLTRSHSDLNAIVQARQQPGNEEQFKISIHKVEWMIPYVIVSAQEKVQLLKLIEKCFLTTMSFRSWELYECPLLPTTSRHIWTVKKSTEWKKPRYIILGFQIGRKNKQVRYDNHFNHCNITNVKVFFSSQYYPYSNLHLDFGHNQFALLYKIYANFQVAYYGKQPEPMLKKSDFKEYAPLTVINCSKQNDFLKQTTVAVRLEFVSANNFPAETANYCLIIHYRMIQYQPLRGSVKKLI